MKIQISVALSMWLAASSAFAACGSDNWEVTVDEDAMTVSPKTLEVCNGDVVTWRNTGESRFQVIFRRGSPPGNPSQADNWFSVAISEQPGAYVYDVKIRGEDLDPTIIISR
jgi:plastocyanin